MYKYHPVLLATVLLVLTAAIPANSSIIRVKPTGDDANTGMSWDLAKKTIQAGVNAAVSGDEIWVAQGTYSGNITLKSGVALKGGFLGDGLTRDYKTYQAVVTSLIIAANDSIIDGFRVTGGTTGIRCHGVSATISNNTIVWNTTGIDVYQGNPVILNNVVTHNSSGINISDTNVITRHPIVANNVITANSTGVECFQSNPYIVNNTIVGSDTGLTCRVSGSPIVSNNIIAFCWTGVLAISGTTPTLSHNNVFGNAGDNYYQSTPAHDSDISTDPMFASVDFGDFHIRSGSLCRDAGDGLAPGLTAIDMDGQVRSQGSAVDIGADESYSEVYSDPYDARIVYVDAQAPLGGDGTTWERAYNTIQSGADDTAKNGAAEVWVAQGVYHEQVKMQPFCHLYGGFAPGDAKPDRNPRTKVSVIDAGSTATGITAVTCCNFASVDGFSVRGGNIGIKCIDGYGKPGLQSIRNNVITDNTTGVSAGYTSPLVSGNSIRRNDIGATASRATLVNNLFVDNGTGYLCDTSQSFLTNNTLVGNGMAIYAKSNSVITNNIVAFNRSGLSSVGTGARVPVLSHNNFYSNMGYDYSPSTLAHGSDISVDPLFASVEFDNFHIRPNSLCRDAGDSLAAGVPCVDIDGQTRPQGGAVDIGADESCDEPYPDPYPVRIVYVDSQASSSGDGTSWDKAYRTIQAGVDDTLTNGPAEVWVARGLYVEQVKMNLFTYLYGGFAPGDTKAERDPKTKVTIIDAGNKTSGSYTIKAADMSTIDGFVLRGGYCGVYCPSALPYVNGAFLKISNNTISGNRTGIDVNESAALISHNILRDNSYRAVLAYLGSPRVICNIITANGGGIDTSYGSAQVVNNTIVANSQNGISCGPSGKPSISNNIVAFNDVGLYMGGGAPFAMSHNNVYGNASGDYSSTAIAHSSDICIDPLFASVDFGNFHIRPGSACIDAGDSLAVGAPSVDIDGQTMPHGSAIDIGADESYDEAYPDPYRSRVVYIDGQAAPGGDGTSWDKAFRTIQAGIDDMMWNMGAEIWVAQGNYGERIKMQPFNHLYGGFARGDSKADQNPRVKTTVIDAGSSDSGTYAVTTASMSTTDGFTIRGGGNGLLCVSPARVSNNSFVSSGRIGTGISCKGGQSTIIGNTISNRAYGIESSGSRCSISSNVLFSNTTGIASSLAEDRIDNNVLFSNDKAIYSYASPAADWPKVVNNTISSNGIGIDCFLYSAASVANNIIAFNATGVRIVNSTPVLACNDVFANTSANYSPAETVHASDISADPGFANRSGNDYHLMAGSPCIDTGIGTYASAYDFENAIRQQDGDGDGTAIVDIGAYEFPLNLQNAKRSYSDGATIVFGGVAVTATFPEAGSTYVERSDRCSGIRVETAKTFVLGAVVNVSGTMQSDLLTGERYVAVSDEYPKPMSRKIALGPLGMSSSNLGGGPLGLQDAVWSWRWTKNAEGKSELTWLPAEGINNIGLLVRICGRVTQIDPGGKYFYLDDGSALSDGTKTGDDDNIGVKVSANGKLYTKGQFLTITGISSCFKEEDGAVRRLVKVRSIEPIAYR